jgi:hypothetical protein
MVGPVRIDPKQIGTNVKEQRTSGPKRQMVRENQLQNEIELHGDGLT